MYRKEVVDVVGVVILVLTTTTIEITAMIEITTMIEITMIEITTLGVEAGLVTAVYPKILVSYSITVLNQVNFDEFSQGLEAEVTIEMTLLVEEEEREGEEGPTGTQAIRHRIIIQPLMWI